MPAIREHDVAPHSLDDDDGMPPLVDNPNPSMTFTFFTDMTPITALSVDPTIPFETVWENTVPPPAELTEPVDVTDQHDCGPYHAQERASHGKKRDASYIPRPPNAFILFRSSFIRSQQVPEKVEGNHSTLSKIIGKYWKTLPREEREVWEAKALVAQAEHRKRYPDWRFRPGANAFAKLKVKDGPQSPNRKRTHQAGRKVKGDSANKKAKGGDERCAVIADLLVEGKTGVDLEDAVRRWEDGAGRVGGERNGACSDKVETETAKEDGDGRREVANPVDTRGKLVSASVNEVPAPNGGPGAVRADRCGGYAPAQPRAQTPDAAHDDRFRIPLTAMFRRSLSAPAAQLSSNQMSPRHDSLDSVFANVSYDIDSPQGVCAPLFGEHVEDLSHAVAGDTIGSLSPLVLPSVLRDGVAARWNDPYNLLETSLGLPPTPDCPELTYTLHTPVSSVVSPVEDPSLAYAFGGTGTCGDFDADMALSAAYAHEPKSWAESALDAHAHMPIFVNGYDWCPQVYSADNATYGYACADAGTGGCHLLEMTNEYVHARAHAGECLPTMAY